MLPIGSDGWNKGGGGNWHRFVCQDGPLRVSGIIAGIIEKQSLAHLTDDERVGLAWIAHRFWNKEPRNSSKLQLKANFG